MSSERAVQQAAEIDDALASHTVAARRLAPQDPRLTGRTEPMVLNAAYLVEDADGQGSRLSSTGCAACMPR